MGRPQGPVEKRWHHAAVIELHARSIGIEDARDIGAKAVLAVIGHGEGLGEALVFVVAGARAHGVHIVPVGFHLGMDQRVAISTLRWK
jgi:hypothetical protein